MLKNYSEKPFFNISEPVCFMVSFLLLLGCLLNFEIFLYSSLFNYFVFVLGSGVVLTTVLFVVYKAVKSDIKIVVTLPFILFIIWALFVFLQHGEALQYKYYRIAVCFVFISSFLVLRINNAIGFYKAVAIVATIEGVWCILQYLGIISSEDSKFKVTGSFSNPNVVAMFLALSIPAILYFMIKLISFYKKAVYSLMLATVGVGLLLLECRTALLGAVFSSGLFLILHFNSIRHFKRKYLFLGILAVGILSIPIGKQLYLYKKDSADGRLLIWRITTQMVLDSPVRGYGTGMFEREYNLRQAKAIQENKLSQKELKNASFVLMAYNDYLEQAVQGGIPAVLLFVLIIVSFLYPYKKEINTIVKDVEVENQDIYYVAYAGFAAFALMGIFNFILQAIPALFLFAVYAGILCTNYQKNNIAKLSVKSNVVRFVLFTSFCIAGYLTFRQFTEVKEYRLMKIAKDYLESGNVVRAENLLEKLQKTKQNSTSYCIIYGKLLFTQRKFQEALGQFDYAKKFSSTPILYDMAAQCHFQLKNSKEAISNFYQLTALSPKTVKYKFGLMQLLVMNKQIEEACIVAQQIISMRVINPNELTDKYQKMAKSLLRNQQKS